MKITLQSVNALENHLKSQATNLWYVHIGNIAKLAVLNITYIRCYLNNLLGLNQCFCFLSSKQKSMKFNLYANRNIIYLIFPMSISSTSTEHDK